MKKNFMLIHIGYPKTATTTLQKHFFPFIDELFYIGKVHNELSQFKINKKFFDLISFYNYSQNWDNYFDKISHEKILISNEDILANCLKFWKKGKNLFISNPVQISQNIKMYFEKLNFNTKILITIRRQDEMVTSLYAQSYAHFYSHFEETNTFKKFVEIFISNKTKEHPFRKNLNYNEVTMEFVKVFGKENVHILLYEDLKENPSKFLRNLFAFFEIPLSSIYERNFFKKVVNNFENKRSIDKYKKAKDISLYDLLYFFKNKYLPNFTISDYQKKLLYNIFGLITVKKNEDISKTIYLTDEQRNLIMEVYRDSNKLLEKNFNLEIKKYGFF